MNLIDLEAFVSVVDHGSVVAAAAGLHLTQSAVTRRIQNLEDALGMPLLDRQTRPLQTTRAGQQTYEFAKPVLSSVNDLKTGVMHGGEPAGDFRFGMSRALGDLAIGLPITEVSIGSGVGFAIVEDVLSRQKVDDRWVALERIGDTGSARKRGGSSPSAISWTYRPSERFSSTRFRAQTGRFPGTKR
jgi:hypothetical protein